MKFGNQSKSSLLFICMIFEIADFDPKLNCTLPDFGTQNKSNIISNKLTRIDNLDPKLQNCKIWSRN